MPMRKTLQDSEETPKKRSKKDLPEGLAAPHKLKMLVLVVNSRKTELYIDFLQPIDVNIEMIMNARGTASAELFGIADTEKSVIFAIVREDRCRKIMRMLDEKFKTVKNGKGIAFTVPLKTTIGVAVYRFLSNNRQEGVL